MKELEWEPLFLICTKAQHRVEAFNKAKGAKFQGRMNEEVGINR